MLKRFSLENIKSKPIKIIATILLVGVILFIAYFSLNKHYIEASTYEINDVVTNYFTCLNKKEFDKIPEYYYPNAENEAYAKMVGAKANVIGMQSVHLIKIYPALVDGEIGIVGFETSVKNNYKGEELVLRETNLFIMRRNQGKWYITKGNDLEDYDKQYINELIETYTPIAKENMSSPKDRILYNNSAFKKLIENKMK